MATGKDVRLARILSGDGKGLVVAMDHAAIAGPMRALADPERIISQVVAGGPNALLLTRGMLCHGRSAMRPSVGIILRISGGFTVLGGSDFQDRIISDVETAIRLGADGVAVTIKFGHDKEGEFIEQASHVADTCARWGMPLLVEALLIERDTPSIPEWEKLCIAARASAELGADLVKIRFPEDSACFNDLVAGCPVPVLVLGGDVKDESEVLAMAERAMQAGAAGFVMGRNVWLSPDPAAMVKKILQVVHS